MKILLYNVSKSFFLLDSYIAKMKHKNRFKVLILFEGKIDKIEGTVIFEVLNKKKLPKLKTSTLEELNNILNKIQIIKSLSIVKSNIFKSITQSELILKNVLYT